MTTQMTLSALKDVFTLIYDKGVNVAIVILMTFSLYYYFDEFFFEVLNKPSIKGVVGEYRPIVLFVIFLSFSIVAKVCIVYVATFIYQQYLKNNECKKNSEINKLERDRIYKVVKNLSISELKTLHCLLTDEEVLTADNRDSTYKILHSNKLIKDIGFANEGVLFEINGNYRSEIEIAIKMKSESLALTVFGSIGDDDELESIIEKFKSKDDVNLYTFSADFKYINLAERQYNNIFYVMHYDNFNKEIFFCLDIKDYLEKYLNTELRNSLFFINGECPR